MLFQPVITKLAPKWYASLETKNARELPSYAVCMVHHLYIVPWAALSIWSDFWRQEEDWKAHEYRLTECQVVPILVGYLVADLLCSALPHGQWEYVVHHTITLWLTSAGTFALPPYTARFIPHLLICDVTQLTYNTSWLLRLAPEPTSKNQYVEKLIAICEISFLLFFLILRVINMPLCFLVQLKHGAAVGMGLARFTFIPLTIMQWFWAMKVVRKVQQKLKLKRP